MNLQSQTPARAVIADDERLMRDQLRARLAQVWPSLEIVAEAKNGLEAIEAVRVHQPDVIFLDIRMPGLTGVEAAKEIAQLDLGDDALLPEMVFITAYDQYALDAFEQGAVDYVLKPAEPERLRVTAEDGALVFRDLGTVWRLGRWHLPLPLHLLLPHLPLLLPLPHLPLPPR